MQYDSPLRYLPTFHFDKDEKYYPIDIERRFHDSKSTTIEARKQKKPEF